MLTVATVLRSGGIYKPEHVYRLKEQCGDLPFVCLSDVPLECDTIELAHGWPSWWSKIELFKAGLFKDYVVYLDLDSTVLGDLNKLQSDDFTMLSDFYKPDIPASGVMAWHGDACPTIYEVFKRNPIGHMAACRTPKRWGDQGFIAQYCDDIKRFNDVYIVSYKRDCAQGIPKDAIVLAYHGNPKPWDVEK